MHLSKRIVQNKQYTTYEEADDEYEFDKALRNKQKQKGKSALEQKLTENTKQCHICFENPIRPKHLILSIANFMDIVAFCQCRKCLIRMFAEQQKNVIFIGTTMGLSQQHRHCTVECIPILCDITPKALMYFKLSLCMFRIVYELFIHFRVYHSFPNFDVIYKLALLTT
ncbi:hypothetical protein AMTRI_Chr13g121360 [Amborella trichopoda]